MVFELLGHSKDEMQAQFGQILDALEYGAPPHGGFAGGIDRVVMLMGDEENIREVIAFPKTQSAADPLFGAPSPVADQENSSAICTSAPWTSSRAAVRLHNGAEWVYNRS